MKQIVAKGCMLMFALCARIEAQPNFDGALGAIGWLAGQGSPDDVTQREYRLLLERINDARAQNRPVDLNGLDRSILDQGNNGLNMEERSSLETVLDAIRNDNSEAMPPVPQQARVDEPLNSTVRLEPLRPPTILVPREPTGPVRPYQGPTSDDVKTWTVPLPVNRGSSGGRQPARTIRRAAVEELRTLPRGISSTNETWRRQAPDDANEFTRERRSALDQAAQAGFKYQSTQYATLETDFLKGDSIPQVSYAMYTHDRGLFRSESRPADADEVRRLMEASGADSTTVGLMVDRVKFTQELARTDLSPEFRREVEGHRAWANQQLAEHAREHGNPTSYTFTQDNFSEGGVTIGQIQGANRETLGGSRLLPTVEGMQGPIPDASPVMGPVGEDMRTGPVGGTVPDLLSGGGGSSGAATPEMLTGGGDMSGGPIA